MINTLKRFAIFGAVAGVLAGCVGQPDVSRDAGPLEAPALETTRFEAAAPALQLVEVDIHVPRSLTVSEANTIRPAEDIVWREDPLGDRHAQVAQLFTEALTPVSLPEADARPTILSIEVQRFHTLTDRARYSIGGTHDILFVATLRDAETGDILSAPQPIDLSFPAYGGQQAIDAEAAGITQRSRITERLRDWAQAQVTAPIFFAVN